MAEYIAENLTSMSVKEHCPTCDGERTCDVHGNVYVPWRFETQDGRNSVSGGVDHSLLQCRGCDTVFYLHNSWDDQDVDQWYDENGETQIEAIRTKKTYPRPQTKTKPKWLEIPNKIDDQLHNIIREMYTAYDNKAYILTAIGLRTALDRATEVLGIDPAITFEGKLRKLILDGWIGTTEYDILNIITDAGSAAVHRGWSPDERDLSQLLSAMEVFLQRAFIVGKAPLSIKEGIPKKPQRKKTVGQNSIMP